MQHQRPSRILGHMEFEVNLPAARTVHSRKKTQIVQVNLNTTIVNIIEEVCKKQEYEIKDYQLWFGQKQLDNDVTIRQSGLPINGVLQLLSVSDASKLKDSTVNLGLQLESGTRLTHKFHHEENLWNILQHWESQGNKILVSNEEGQSKVMIPVCHYMRQTIAGQEQLQEKTLKALGLTHGSAVIRFFHREENQVGQQQANVSSVMSIPMANVNEKICVVPSNNVSSSSPNNNSGPSSNSIITSPPQSQSSILDTQGPGHTISESHSVNVPEDIKPVKEEPVLVKNEEIKSNKVQQKEELMDISEGSSSTNMTPSNDVERNKPLTYSDKDKLVVLGENNAMLYHLDDVRSRKDNVDEPDDFFDITVNDVKSIYRGLRTKVKELEEAPLLTDTLRQDEELTLADRLLKCHPQTVVRIRFPDRFVLQGTFNTTDLVYSLTTFVRRYMIDPTIQFELFTTPPKTVLDEAKTLLGCKLLGCTIVYFGTDSAKLEKYLRDDVYSQASDPEQVFKNSNLTETMTTTAHSTAQHDTTTSLPCPVQSKTKTVPVANVKSSESTEATARVNHAPSGAVPKWFKGAPKK